MCALLFGAREEIPATARLDAQRLVHTARLCVLYPCPLGNYAPSTKPVRFDAEGSIYRSPFSVIAGS